jgi:hypothetical protein
MNLAEAIELAKKFPICRPKIFKGFTEWGLCDTETDGYVVFANTASAKELGLKELEDYVRNHNLEIDYGRDYLMIRTPY